MKQSEIEERIRAAAEAAELAGASLDDIASVLGMLRSEFKDRANNEFDEEDGE